MSYANVSDRSDPELGLAVDPDTLDGEMEYRWGHVRPERQTTLLMRGYRPVSRSQDGVRLLIDPEVGEDEDEVKGSADDTIRYGDTILMCAPKGVVQERRQRNAETTRARLQANKEQFLEQADRAGHKLGAPVRVVGPDKED